MPRKRSHLSRCTHRVVSLKLARRKERIDLLKLEQEVYEAMHRLDEMRRQYAEYLASQQNIQTREQTQVKHEELNEALKIEIVPIEVSNEDTGNS